jgi:hypothetical protein
MGFNLAFKVLIFVGCSGKKPEYGQHIDQREKRDQNSWF